MNPWLIIAFLIALGGAYLGGEHQGHKSGVAEQKATDQGEFDAVNKKLADNTAKANEIYRTKQAENLTLATERDTLKTTLEQQRQANEKENRTLSDRYSALKLRFTIAGDAGRGAGSGSPATASGDTPGAASPGIVVELPDAIAAGLRQLALDADELRTAYGICYGYVTQVK